MADMFRTLEREGGSGGPEWLSDHPNPGNRYEAISREADMLPVNRPRGDSPAFVHMEARLDRLPEAPTTEQVARARARR
jgi:predicted Zn-dependent protease